MVKTFRERGNHEIAASLETAAEKQAEAVLRTQQINVRTSSTLPVPAKPVVAREPTPIRSPVRVRVRRSAPSSPVPPALEEEEKRSSRGAESEWESEDDEVVEVNEVVEVVEVVEVDVVVEVVEVVGVVGVVGVVRVVEVEEVMSEFNIMND